MKRVWTAAVLILVILGVGTLSLFQLSSVKELIEEELGRLSSLVSQEDGTALSKGAEDFEHLWEEKERMIMRYIHHDELDAITGKVARLRSLAKYEDYSEFAAEIDSLRHLIFHIYESELVTWENIF